MIQRLSAENPLWGAPRIHGELLKLGYDVAQATVGKYKAKRHGPPSQSWRTFVNSHRSEIVTIDFLTVSTATSPVLYVIVLGERHLQRVLWEIQPRDAGAVVSTPVLGGLHHRHWRQAA